MRRSGFIALPSGATAYPLAACAQQPAVGKPLRALRHRPKTIGHVEAQRGRAVFRILIGCLLVSGAMAMPAAAENAPGVTDSEIKIGQTMPYTGPGAWLSSLGLAEKAYMQMINDQGGINGRRINLISVDDGFLTWRTGNETRKLIDVDHVAFTFGSIGTPTQLEVAKYLNERKIPQLFIESGAYRWGNYKATPYTIAGMRPSNRLGARLYARYILKQDPNANDPGMKDWRAWMSKYLPGEDVRRPSFAYGYNSAGALIQVLKQAGSDLSRENIMRQATNLRDLELPMLLPGIKVNTSPTDYWAVQQLQLMRFDGKRWVRFGDLVYDE
jgi:hypothetical protein